MGNDINTNNKSSTLCICFDVKSPKERRLIHIENFIERVLLNFKLFKYSFEEIIDTMYINGSIRLSCDRWSFLVSEYILDLNSENKGLLILLNLLIPEYSNTKESLMDIISFLYIFTKDSSKKNDLFYSLILTLGYKNSLLTFKGILNKIIVYVLYTVPVIVNNYISNNVVYLFDEDMQELKESFKDAFSLFSKDIINKLQYDIYLYFIGNDKFNKIEKNIFCDFLEREKEWFNPIECRKLLISSYFDNPRRFMQDIGKIE